MKESTNVRNIEERENIAELEPVVLAQVTAVTGTAPGGSGDGDNIVWGTYD